MRKKVLFIHSGGSQGPHEGSSDLVAYLRHALGAGYEVLFPKMPDPEYPEYVSWREQLAEELATSGGEVILVGHSLGGSVLLKYLSEEVCFNTIAGLFLVAAVYWGKKNWEVDEYVLREDFSSKLPQIPRVFLYHSKDDAVVPFKHVKYFAEKLPGATVRAYDSKGHLFSRGIPELVNDIRNLERSVKHSL